MPWLDFRQKPKTDLQRQRSEQPALLLAFFMHTADCDDVAIDGALFVC